MLHGTGRRMFGRGDFRLILLDLINRSPKHGYSIIEELEAMTGGLYAPSPGIIYPALQFLDDGELIEVTQENNRKTYRITEKGAALLTENREHVDAVLDRLARVGGTFGRRGGHEDRHGRRERPEGPRDEGRRDERPGDERGRGRGAPQDFVDVALTSLASTASLARGRVSESFLVDKLKEVERLIASAAMQAEAPKPA